MRTDGKRSKNSYARSHPPAQGRRHALRARLLGDPRTATDAELLECLLTLAHPRRNTGDLAHVLLSQFGTIGGVIAAHGDQFNEIAGLTEAGVALLRLAGTVKERMRRVDGVGQPRLSNWNELLDYLAPDRADGPERIRVLHLNSRDGLIRDEEIARGQVSINEVAPREVIRRALDLGSVAVVLVHNYFGKVLAPTPAHVELLRSLRDATGRIGITAHDLLILSSDEHLSLRSAGVF